ncbi:hypothetical protein SD81_037370 [Tolypothrix campylonemoides VB511288]|nr:hypothetical protein SD81_037370 [Tolypothrix campylonemoides VB511288]
MRNATTLSLATAMLLALPVAAPAADAARGEYSRSAALAAPAWRMPAYPQARTTRVAYRELAIERLLKLQRDNAAPARKATQIGLARRADLEARLGGDLALRWVADGRGGAVARVELASPDALGLRVGLRATRMDDRVELRVGGSDAPAAPVAQIDGARMRRLVDAEGLYWTPATDGERQILEFHRPAGVPASAVRVGAPKLSHLVANSRNDFKIIEKVGESGSCNVDTVCRVAELGQRFVDAKNAVAHMIFVRGGGTYICTGTLLADTVPSTQVPYFWSANHCFAADTRVAPVASQMQTVANTLNTVWRYETTGCRNLTSATTTRLTGGAAYLYADHLTDAMLLRLNDAAPAGAYFSGWSAAPLAGSTEVFAIHHPQGDAKKVSSGQLLSSNPTGHTVGWLSGTTEGGSSGSGLFVRARSGEWELRGGLYGGDAACSNSGSLANALNQDHYSRLDVVFPQVRQYLASEAVPMNGSAPLLPPGTPTAAPPAASQPSLPAASAPTDARGGARGVIRFRGLRLPLR